MSHVSCIDTKSITKCAQKSILKVSIRQLRLRARSWLGRELAAAAKVSVDTIVRFERGEELKERTIDALQRALETAGVEFTNGDQPGVRLTKAAAGNLSSRPTRQNGRLPRKQFAVKPRRSSEKKR